MAVVDGVPEDLDAVETSEWLEAIDSVLEHDGPGRARHILTRVVERAQRGGTGSIATLNTPYVNTIPLEREAQLPGDPAVERRLRSIIRWNAMAIVVRANKHSSELGGHIASYQSLATLYEVGFNHFWHAPSESHGGDLVYFQGHWATPPREITRGRSWRAASRRSSSTAFARRSQSQAA